MCWMSSCQHHWSCSLCFCGCSVGGGAGIGAAFAERDNYKSVFIRLWFIFWWFVQLHIMTARCRSTLSLLSSSALDKKTNPSFSPTSTLKHIKCLPCRVLIAISLCTVCLKEKKKPKLVISLPIQFKPRHLFFPHPLKVPVKHELICKRNWILKAKKINQSIN